MVTAVAPDRYRESARVFFTSDETPDVLAWVEHLSPRHFRQFVVELHQALSTVLIDPSKIDDLIHLIEDWEATAGIDADPELAKRLKTPREQKHYREYVA